MINGFKFSREEIVKMIEEKCERTKDGIYWTPNISAYLTVKGLNDDSKYYYKREDFFYKVYYTKIDLDYFLAKKKLDIYTFNMMKEIDKKFLYNNYDTFGLTIKKKVKPYDFTVEDLLDTYVFMRYALFQIKN